MFDLNSIIIEGVVRTKTITEKEAVFDLFSVSRIEEFTIPVISTDPKMIETINKRVGVDFGVRVVGKLGARGIYLDHLEVKRT